MWKKGNEEGPVVISLVVNIRKMEILRSVAKLKGSMLFVADLLDRCKPNEIRA